MLSCPGSVRAVQLCMLCATAPQYRRRTAAAPLCVAISCSDLQMLISREEEASRDGMMAGLSSDVAC